MAERPTDRAKTPAPRSKTAAPYLGEKKKQNGRAIPRQNKNAGPLPHFDKSVTPAVSAEVWPVAETDLSMTALHSGGTKLRDIFHVYMLPRVEVRRCGSVRVWKCGSVELCKSGSFEARKCRSVEVCECGNVIMWKRGSVEVWKRGSVEVWKRGSVEVCNCVSV